MQNSVEHFRAINNIKLNLLAITVGRHVVPVRVRLEALLSIHQVNQAVACLIALQIDQSACRQIAQYFTHEAIMRGVIETLLIQFRTKILSFD